MVWLNIFLLPVKINVIFIVLERLFLMVSCTGMQLEVQATIKPLAIIERYRTILINTGRL